jgi:Proteasome non-ATPase 26S subunit
MSDQADEPPLVGSTCLEELLANIRDLLAVQQEEGGGKEASSPSPSSSTSTQLRSAWVALSEATNYAPRDVLNVVVPHLFQDDSDNGERKEGAESKRMDIDDGEGDINGRRALPWSSRDALAVLGFVVGCDANRYLQEASDAVRKEALRIAHSLDSSMTVSPELLSVMIHQLSSPNVSVSSNSATTIRTCCQKLGGSLRLDAISAIVGAWELQQLAMQSDPRNRNQASTIAVRCASSLVDVLCLEEGANPKSLDLAASASSKVLLPMLNDATDPLVQMSTLDLLEHMAKARPMHHWRAHWLFSEPVRSPILALCGGSDVENASPDPLLGGPALRVAAALCRIAHDRASSELLGVSGGPILDGFYVALKNSYASASGETDRLALIDAISSFASASSEALTMVLNDPEIRRAWLSLSVAQPKLKAAVLYSVAMVLDPARSNETATSGDIHGAATVPPPPPPSDVPFPDNALGMRLFTQLGQTNNDEGTGMVLSLAKSALPEVRLASYALLGSVAKLQTGGQLLFTHGDFLEFLLDRRNEATVEGREAKWELVRTVLASPVTGLLAQEIVRTLETYVKEGPHYRKVQRWELATDS